MINRISTVNLRTGRYFSNLETNPDLNINGSDDQPGGSVPLREDMAENQNTSWTLAPGLLRKSPMGPMLVEACPSFALQWEQFLAEWAEEPDLPIYVALSDFARHLSVLLADNNGQVLQRVFSVVERFIVEGDGYVSEAAIVGIIEDLQNTNLHEGTTPDQYLPFLLPQTRRWWAKVQAFWSKGRLLTDD